MKLDSLSMTAWKTLSWRHHCWKLHQEHQNVMVGHSGTAEILIHLCDAPQMNGEDARSVPQPMTVVRGSREHRG